MTLQRYNSMNNTYPRIKRTEHHLAHTPAALKRDADTDYTTGYFFVTINVRDHCPILGTIAGHYDAATHRAEDACVGLSSFGERVQQCWEAIPSAFQNVQLIDAQVMPEHFHGLLYMEQAERVYLGKVVGKFKKDCTRAYREITGREDEALFEAGYNETTPVTPEELQTKVDYIHTNPERRLIKQQFPACFALRRGQHSPNWTPERIAQGLRHDTYFSANAEALQNAIDDLQPRLLQSGGNLVLDYIGTPDLLQASRKLPLICHRADADRFAEHTTAVLREAEAGAVIVSAFISPKEREILKNLIIRGYPVIEIADNGFGRTYKPWGDAFYACAENHLLQITPWAYRYEKAHTPISRPICMVMNELTRLICGQDEYWWNK